MKKLLGSFVCLSTEMGITSDFLIACMRDQASVNSVAVRTLKIVFRKVFDIRVFLLHT